MPQLFWPWHMHCLQCFLKISEWDWETPTSPCSHSSETTKLIQCWFKKCFSVIALYCSIFINLRLNHNNFQFHKTVIRCKWGSSNSIKWLTHYLQDMSLFLMQIFFWACVCSDRYSFYSVMVIFPYLCHRFFSWHRFLEVRSICRGFVDNTSCSWVFWLSLLEHPPGRMCCGYFAHCGKPAINFNEIRF